MRATAFVVGGGERQQRCGKACAVFGGRVARSAFRPGSAAAVRRSGGRRPLGWPPGTSPSATRLATSLLLMPAPRSTHAHQRRRTPQHLASKVDATLRSELARAACRRLHSSLSGSSEHRRCQAPRQRQRRTCASSQRQLQARPGHQTPQRGLAISHRAPQPPPRQARPASSLATGCKPDAGRCALSPAPAAAQGRRHGWLQRQPRPHGR